MKIKINGNVASLISNIKFDDLAKATAVSPMFIKNDTGKKVYGIETGTIGTINDAGVCFSYANAEGFAALNICFCPDYTQDEIKEEILDSLAPAIDKYNFFEDAISSAIEDRASARAELAANIEIG